MTIDQIWQPLQQNFPSSLDIVGLDDYLKFIRNVAIYGLKPSGAIIPNGNVDSCTLSSFYDHTDELFCAAFRKQDSQGSCIQVCNQRTSITFRKRMVSEHGRLRDTPMQKTSCSLLLRLSLVLSIPLTRNSCKTLKL